jgi:hypothetical protein
MFWAKGLHCSCYVERPLARPELRASERRVHMTYRCSTWQAPRHRESAGWAATPFGILGLCPQGQTRGYGPKSPCARLDGLAGQEVRPFEFWHHAVEGRGQISGFLQCNWRRVMGLPSIGLWAHWMELKWTKRAFSRRGRARAFSAALGYAGPVQH